MPGAYISFPFCSQKCTFCNFASGVFPQNLEEDYYAALLFELKTAKWETPPDTVYLGGGTPSQMDTGQLSQVMAAIPGNPWREATMEAAPGSLTDDRVRSWRRAGINRASLGVQSFAAPELIKTGRKHNAETVAADCALLRVHGISNISIDLIAGLPFQTLDSWKHSLDWVQRMDVPHVSVYMLEVDQDSRLGLQILEGGLAYGAGNVPSEEEVAEFYEIAVAHLASFGIFRYEISNFSKPGYESRHNLKYWELDTYLGFGADAHSFNGVYRWSNAEMAAEYVDRWRKKQKLQNEPEEACLQEDKFLVGLRLTSGVKPEPQDWIRFAEPIQRFTGNGLLERAGSMLRLTSRGVLYSNDVIQEFLNV